MVEMTNLEIKKEIESDIKDMIKEKAIGKEDKEVAKTILTWIRLGKAEAKEVNKKYVKNLTANGFANKDGYLLKGKDDDEGIWFVLAIAGAYGYME